MIFVLAALPAILGLVGLVFDAGLMMADNQNLQHAVDAAATASAQDLLLGKTTAQAEATATSYVRSHNSLADAQLTISIPPATGSYSGKSGYVEVTASRQYQTRLMHMLGVSPQQQMTARAVAGHQSSTAGAAIVVPDPNPPRLTVDANLLILPALGSVIAGLETLGVGSLRVNGAILVNNTWGGVDENGNPAGSGPGPPYGVGVHANTSVIERAGQRHSCCGRRR